MNVVEINERNWGSEVGAARELVVVCFGAPDCNASVAMNPKLQNLARKFEGKVKFGTCNIQNDAALAKKHGVTRTPWVILFQNDKRVHELVSVISESDLSKRLHFVLGTSD